MGQRCSMYLTDRFIDVPHKQYEAMGFATFRRATLRQFAQPQHCQLPFAPEQEQSVMTGVTQLYSAGV